MIYLAGDIGGTKALLALADYRPAECRFEIIHQKRFECASYQSLGSIINEFLELNSIDPSEIQSASFGLPGPVSSRAVELTNLPWIVDADKLQVECGLRQVDFINDFYAAALGVELLKPNHVETIFAPSDSPVAADGNRLVIGAGTGLGVAPVFYDGESYLPQASEGGHFDFAPISETQQLLLNWLWQRWPHVSYERLLSGAGLETLYEFFQLYKITTTYDHQDDPTSQNLNKNRLFDAQNMNMGIDVAMGQQVQELKLLSAPQIQQAADNGDSVAQKAIIEFVTIYGAYVGAVALLWNPPNGIFLAGGIAAKILNWMRKPYFTEAYLEKGRMQKMVELIPVSVITDQEFGLKGAVQHCITKST